MALEINGEHITDALLAEEFAHIKEKYRSALTGKRQVSLAPLPDDETLMQLVKENITRKTLLRQQARKSEIEISEAELTEALTQQSAAPPAGMTTEVLREHMRLQLKINALLTRVSDDIDTPTARHFKIFYESNRAQYYKERRVALAFIACTEPRETAPRRKLRAHLLRLQRALMSMAAAQRLAVFQAAMPTQDSAAQTAFNVSGNNNDNNNDKEPQTPLQQPGGRVSQAAALSAVFLPRLQQLAALHAGNLRLQELKAFATNIRTAVAPLPLHTVTMPIVLSPYIYLFYVAKESAAGIPPLAEIRAEVEADLLRELREHKQEIYIAKLMKQSKLIDHGYI